MTGAHAGAAFCESCSLRHRELLSETQTTESEPPVRKARPLRIQREASCVVSCRAYSRRQALGISTATAADSAVEESRLPPHGNRVISANVSLPKPHQMPRHQRRSHPLRRQHPSACGAHTSCGVCTCTPIIPNACGALAPPAAPAQPYLRRLHPLRRLRQSSQRGEQSGRVLSAQQP